MRGAWIPPKGLCFPSGRPTLSTSLFFPTISSCAYLPVAVPLWSSPTLPGVRRNMVPGRGPGWCDPVRRCSERSAVGLGGGWYTSFGDDSRGWRVLTYLPQFLPDGRRFLYLARGS